MTITARLAQGQRQTLGFRQIQAAGLLRLTNEGLAADLARRAAGNPFLRLRLPAGAALAEVEPASDDTEGFYQHLAGQLRLIAAARADPHLTTALVEALDANGWLDRPLAEIAAAANRPLPAAELLLTALQQGVEPVGLFARDLADCLRLQAADRGQLSTVMAAVLHHLEVLTTGGIAALIEATGAAAEEVALCLARIRRMDPRPGLAFGGTPAPLRAPDIIVSRQADGWQIGLNRSTLPVLDLTPKGPADAGMRALRSEAEWLASIVERRNRTVLAVARAVLDRQRDFLEDGPGALLALSRTQIAAALGLHDSTVGRVARDLLVETPQGLRSLCSLFGSGPSGAAPAGAAIRHRLGQLVAAETPQTPLDDAALAVRLTSEGKPVSRRTVAKYRAMLGIPPHNQRRR